MPDREIPDTYGLPVYRVSKSIKQRHGDELHILKGFEVMGQTQWTHVEIWRISEILAGMPELVAVMTAPQSDFCVGAKLAH